MISLELPSKVFVTHYSSNKGTSMPFKKLCEICSKSNEFADDLLNHATVDIDAYSEFLSLTAPIITSEKKQFKENCSVLKISELMNVTEEAFALLVMENCFKHWKFLAESRLRKFHEKGNRPMCRGISKEVRTSSSTPCESPPSSSASSSSSLPCSLLTQEENAATGASFDSGEKTKHDLKQELPLTMKMRAYQRITTVMTLPKLAQGICTNTAKYAAKTIRYILDTGLTEGRSGSMKL